MGISPAEETYIDAYRQMQTKAEAIVGTIAKVRSICESLKDWQATSAMLANPGAAVIARQWDDSGLAELSSLKLLLAEHYRGMAELEKAWSRLANNQRIALAPPSTLRQANA